MTTMFQHSVLPKRSVVTLILMVVLALLFAACNKKEEEKSPESALAPPVEPTKSAPKETVKPTALQGYMDYNPYTKTWTWKLRYPPPKK